MIVFKSGTLSLFQVFFKITLDILSPLYFHIKKKKFKSISAGDEKNIVNFYKKKSTGIMIGIASDLQINLERMNFFCNIKSSNPCTSLISPLI